MITFDPFFLNLKLHYNHKLNTFCVHPQTMCKFIQYIVTVSLYYSYKITIALNKRSIYYTLIFNVHHTNCVHSLACNLQHNMCGVVVSCNSQSQHNPRPAIISGNYSLHLDDNSTYYYYSSMILHSRLSLPGYN